MKIQMPDFKTFLHLLLEITFEDKFEQISSKLVIKNEALLCLFLNLINGLPAEWRNEIEELLKVVIKTIQGSYINYHILSNVRPLIV